MHSFGFATCHVNIAGQWGSRAKEKDMKNQQEEPSDTLDGFKGKKNKEGTINKRDLHTLQFAEAVRAWSAVLVLTCSSQGFKLWCNTWLYVYIYLLSFIFPSPQQWTVFKAIWHWLVSQDKMYFPAAQTRQECGKEVRSAVAPPGSARKPLVFIVGYSDNCQPSNWGLVSYLNSCSFTRGQHVPSDLRVSEGPCAVHQEKHNVISFKLFFHVRDLLRHRSRRSKTLWGSHAALFLIPTFLATKADKV